MSVDLDDVAWFVFGSACIAIIALTCATDGVDESKLTSAQVIVYAVGRGVVWLVGGLYTLIVVTGGLVFLLDWLRPLPKREPLETPSPESLTYRTIRGRELTDE